MAAQGRLGPRSWLFLFLGSKPSFLSEPLLVPLPPPGSRGPAEHTSRRPLPPSQDTSGPDELRPWQVAQSETDLPPHGEPESLSLRIEGPETNHAPRMGKGQSVREAQPSGVPGRGVCGGLVRSDAVVCTGLSPASETVPSPQMTSGARADPPARSPRSPLETRKERRRAADHDPPGTQTRLGFPGSGP